MHKGLQWQLFIGTVLWLITLAAVCPEGVSAAQSADDGLLYTFDDQFVRIEGKMLVATGRNAFGVEAVLTPKSGWKLLAGSSSAIKPLQLKIAPSECLKPKGAVHLSQPDLSGTDDSGVYTEYFTKTATIRQELTRVACKQQSVPDGLAKLKYLLCQDNKCMGPFVRDIRFKVPNLK